MNPSSVVLPPTGKVKKATISVETDNGETYTSVIDSPIVEMSVSYSLGETELNQHHVIGTHHRIFVVAIRCGVQDSESAQFERVS